MSDLVLSNGREFCPESKLKCESLKKSGISNMRHRYILTVPFDPANKLSGSPIPFTTVNKNDIVLLPYIGVLWH